MAEFSLTWINLLISIWLIPGLIASALLIKKDLYAIIFIPILGTAFWSIFFSFTNLQNISALDDYALGIYFFNALTLLIIYIKKRALTFGYFGVILIVNIFEALNYQYGLINPTGSSIGILNSLYNMEYSLLYEWGAPQIYIVGLSFFFTDVPSILPSINFITGMASFLIAGIILCEVFHIDKRILFLSIILPIFNFEVISWILRIRPHFLASGATLLFISACYLYREGKSWDSKVMILTSLFLILNARTESIIIFALVILIIFTLDLKELFLSKYTIIFFVVTYLSTIESLAKYEGLRGRYFTLFVYILFYLLLLLGDKKEKISNLIKSKFNVVFSFCISLVAVLCIYLYGSLALQSYRVMFVKLSDPGTGYGTLFVFYLSLLLVVKFNESLDINNVVFCIYLTILLIFISGPLQHSVFGWATFYIDYFGEDRTIYNPFDESQSRSIMQFYLLITPLITCSIFNKQRKEKLTNKEG